MAILSGHVFLIGVVMIVFGQLESFQAAPINPDNISQDSVSDKDTGGTNTEYKFRNMVTVIFVNSCDGKELNYSIKNVRGDCYNVQLNDIKQVIKTEPGDMKLFLFDQPGCTGEQIEYKSSSQLNINMPFVPASFAVARR